MIIVLTLIIGISIGAFLAAVWFAESSDSEIELDEHESAISE
jgi:hypothetical protein